MDPYEQEIRMQTEGVLDEDQMQVVNELLAKIENMESGEIVRVDVSTIRNALDLIARLAG